MERRQMMRTKEKIFDFVAMICIDCYLHFLHVRKWLYAQERSDISVQAAK